MVVGQLAEARRLVMGRMKGCWLGLWPDVLMLCVVDTGGQTGGMTGQLGFHCDMLKMHGFATASTKAQ